MIEGPVMATIVGRLVSTGVMAAALVVTGACLLGSLALFVRSLHFLMASL